MRMSKQETQDLMVLLSDLQTNDNHYLTLSPKHQELAKHPNIKMLFEIKDKIDKAVGFKKDEEILKMFATLHNVYLDDVPTIDTRLSQKERTELMDILNKIGSGKKPGLFSSKKFKTVYNHPRLSDMFKTIEDVNEAAKNNDSTGVISRVNQLFEIYLNK